MLITAGRGEGATETKVYLFRGAFLYNKFLGTPICLHGAYKAEYYFVKTPCKFIIAKVSLRKLGSLSVLNVGCIE